LTLITTQLHRNDSTDIRYALGALAKFNLSFSPGFSLGSQRALNFSNRFNGFGRCAEIFNISMQTVETVSAFKRATG
jgi:hypothetical protein